MGKQKVYIETSVISYLTSKQSRDIIIAGRQEITKEWWQKAKNKFDCYISQIVIEEISKGDKTASANRLKTIQHIAALGYHSDVENLALEYIKLLNIPEKSKLDAFHLAYAVLYEIEFLLSWNCKHIANAMVNYRIKGFNQSKALFVPFLCTPNELLEV